MFSTLAVMFSVLIASRVSGFVVQGVRVSSVSRWASKRAISISTVGEEGTASFRVFFKDGEKTISPWHDIPLYAKSEGLVNLITEIPKNTKAKYEISANENFNPIAQDTKNGKLRDYHGPIYWNYGCLPQTWENPNDIHDELKVYGDNDPLDVIEIGSKVLEIGSITPVKPLGIYAMIDSGELDWKLIVINENDPLFDKLNNIEDINQHLPHTLSGIIEWFRWYKTPDLKPLNKFGFNDECLNQKKAYEIIKETHESWKLLKEGKIDPKGMSLNSADLTK